MRAGETGTLKLTSKDRKALEALVDRAGVPLRAIIRAWIILLSAAGHPTAGIAARLGVSASTVLYWRNRFCAGGLDQVMGRQKITRRRHDDEEIRKVVETTLQKWPVRGRRWSVRNISKFLGISRSAVQRIWKSYGLKPVDDEFKFRHDESFYLNAREISGVYIASDESFAVALLTQDVKSSARHLDNPPAVSKDDTLISRVLRAIARRPATQPVKPDMLYFLKWVDSHTPADAIVHLLVPRRSLVLFPHAFRWLKRHPRFQIHIVPREVPSRKFLCEWYAKTAGSSNPLSSFSFLPDFQAALSEYLDIYARPTSIKRLPISRPFFWVRPDRNYQTDERQLELTFSKEGAPAPVSRPPEP